MKRLLSVILCLFIYCLRFCFSAFALRNCIYVMQKHRAIAVLNYELACYVFAKEKQLSSSELRMFLLVLSKIQKTKKIACGGKK